MIKALGLENSTLVWVYPMHLPSVEFFIFNNTIMDQEIWEGFKSVHHLSTIAYIESNWGKEITLKQFSEEHLKTCKSKKGKPSHIRHMFKYIVEQGWIKDASASV